MKESPFDPTSRTLLYRLKIPIQHLRYDMHNARKDPQGADRTDAVL